MLEVSNDSVCFFPSFMAKQKLNIQKEIVMVVKSAYLECDINKWALKIAKSINLYWQQDQAKQGKIFSPWPKYQKQKFEDWSHSQILVIFKKGYTDV